MTEQTIVDALATELATLAGWDYSPGVAFPDNKVPVTIAGMPMSDPHGDGSAVCLTTYGSGPEPDSKNGWYYPRLQVKTRALDPLVAMALDGTAYDALQELSGALPGSTWTLTDCYALQSEPQPLGRDDAGRWEYVRNYQLTAERAG